MAGYQPANLVFLGSPYRSFGYEYDGTPVWKAIGIYGWPDAANKFKTWQLMKNLCRKGGLPTTMFGDFKEITSLSEKEGGAVRSETQMDAFRETIDYCALCEMGFHGSCFTWKRGKSSATFIRE